MMFIIEKMLFGRKYPHMFHSRAHYKLFKALGRR